jgi:PAS domain S-box-containing protein
MVPGRNRRRAIRPWRPHLIPAGPHDLGRNRCSILFGFSPLGVDKWGGLLADFVLWGSIVAQMKRELIARFRHLVALWITGSVTLAFATWACFQLGLNFATTAFVFLNIIVLLSLLDSFTSSAVFSVVAVGCLNYFFTEPLYTLYVDHPQDIAALATFLFTSLAVTSLVRRVRRLGEAHREQTRLLDLTHDPIFVRDRNDVITYWSRGAEELYGWKSEQVLGKVTHQLLQTVFPAPLEQITETLLGTGRWEGELLHTKRDGTQVIVASRWSLQQTDSGYPLGTLETNNNITDRKCAEDALRRTQETYLAEAQQLSHTGSFGWHVSSGEIFWSEESFRIFGYDKTIKPSIALILQRVHPDDAALVQQVIARAEHDQQDFDFECRLMMPDGSVKYLHVVAHAVREESGKLQFMGALMDTTARKEAETAVRDSEQRYRHLFEQMPIAMWQLNGRSVVELFTALRTAGVTDLGTYFDQDPDFLPRMMDALVVEEVNEHAVKMFGAKERSQLLGRGLFFWRRSPDAFRRAMESRFRGLPTFQEETKLVTLDGREIDVLYTAARLGSVGEQAITLGGAIDITDRVRAQEQLQRVQADFAHAARLSVLGEIAASIAHEVNQPLAAVRTNGETGLRWLDRPEPNIPKARQLMRRVLDDARRAADIIARIRAMAAGRTPQQTALELHDVIAESMLFLRHELQSKGVSASLDLAPALPQVTGDRTQLHQVVVNLAINAVQAMAQSGTGRRSIFIRTVLSDPETVCCIIEDSGPGIDPTHLPHLFDRFFTTKDGGMGMGLPICRSIIEAHDGHIQADNKSALGGARFSFSLPAHRASAG